ncbi:MAG: hypothetical protein ACK4RN_03200 [Pseudorhodobacter sp.]
MTHHVLLLAITALALVACVPAVAPLPPGPVVVDGVAYDVTRRASQAVLVRRVDRPFQNWEGAEARRAADRFCQGRAKASIRDRFVGDGWLIVEGCA